jgi:hypothetical protein
MVVDSLMQDGWQVFSPILDHGHQTDLLISDGPNYYRMQIKTVEATGAPTILCQTAGKTAILIWAHIWPATRIAA